MTRHGPGDDSVAQYVAGTMQPTEAEAFELHLLECHVCRTAVRTGAAARVALAGSGHSPRVASPVWRGRGGWLLAAAAITAVIVVAGRADSRSSLGKVIPAPFVAGAVRSAGDSIGALIDSGMAAYSRSDFRTASRLLARAAVVDSSPPVAFFLGVSLLLIDDERAALDPLARAVVATPYAVEAAYYRAKAFVRMKQPDSAIAVLARAMATDNAPQLAALADSIRRR